MPGGKYLGFGFAFWFMSFRIFHKVKKVQEGQVTMKNDFQLRTVRAAVNSALMTITPDHMCSSARCPMPNPFGKIPLNWVHGKQIRLISLQEIGTTYNKIAPNYAWN